MLETLAHLLRMILADDFHIRNISSLVAYSCKDYFHVAIVLQLTPAAQDGAVLTRNLLRFNPPNGMDMRQEKIIDREYIL